VGRRDCDARVGRYFEVMPESCARIHALRWMRRIYH
jgi:hypothetical protein